MPTNFHIAPPSKVVDGLSTTPIDIQGITGRLTFDGGAQTGEGDVTLDFIVGPAGGCPVFDLRQTVLEAWLDGGLIPASQVGHHDFGGGPDAELRVLESVLAAGSAHTLRLRYSLGIPQASTAGSYQPGLAWSAGPRLAFNFGFTDLGPGRYLEAWVPANLIFDQYAIHLEVELLATGVAHTVITNAQVTVLAANHWALDWPAHSTALSTLLEVRALDAVAALTDIVVLPVSGATVSVEAWKLAGAAPNLATEMARIKDFLVANENDVGGYAHGGRFVAWLHAGGMEYDGGTTTSTGALRHETFHSWWGRGIKPASQPDAWWDEAWTVYNMAAAPASSPFDFTDPPIAQSVRNPWSRLTPGSAYASGPQLFAGLAALAGTAALGDFMDEFYREWNGEPATTVDLEAQLLRRVGDAHVVDAFHRFVYGFANPAPAPDLWLRDEAAHTGADFWDGTFWDSPDLWVRNSDDGGLLHQPPEHGKDNWFYAWVRNRGAATARHFALTFNVKFYAGLQFSYPEDFLPAVAATCDFELGAGESRIVKARWPRAHVPAADTHPCLLAAAIARGDHPVAGRFVWEHNNLAQKNLTVVDLQPNDWIVIPFELVNWLRSPFPWFELVLLRPKRHPRLESELLHAEPALFHTLPLRSAALRARFQERPVAVAPEGSLDCGAAEPAEEPRSAAFAWTSRNPRLRQALTFAQARPHPFGKGVTAGRRVALPYGEPLRMGWRVRVPAEAEPGECLRLHLARRNWLGRKPQGGIALEIRVV